MVSKVQERIFADEAAKLLRAHWEIIDIPEPPDFEIRVDGGTLGLEVSQIFVDAEAGYGSPLKRDEVERQKLLSSISKKYYEAVGKPIHVKVLGHLSPNSIPQIVHALIQSRPVYRGAESLTNDTKVYVGYTNFFLKALPDTFGCYSRWITVDDRVGWPRQVTQSDLQSAVDKKEQKLSAYTNKYRRTILLLVADRSYKSGKLYGEPQTQVRNPGFNAIYFMSRLEHIERVG